MGAISQITADDDQAAIKAWLAKFQDSPRTFESYRKEGERIWLWATQAAGKPMSSLTHEDMLAFKAFIRNPPNAWIGRAKVSRTHPDWRPFHGPLSEASARQTETIVNSLFSWLVEGGYLVGNPLSLSRRRRRAGASRKVTRYIPRDAMEWLLTAAGRESATRGTASAIRDAWIIHLLYFAGLRISEICENTFGGFEARKPEGKYAKSKRIRWFLSVIGKGSEPRTIPIPLELLPAMCAYRATLGLSRYPATGEGTPLVLSLNGKSPIERARVHEIVKSFFARMTRLQPDGISLPSSVSAHWLRHSRGSHLAADGVRVNTIRELLGHSSLATTSKYVHSEENDMHDEISSVGTKSP